MQYFGVIRRHMEEIILDEMPFWWGKKQKYKCFWINSVELVNNFKIPLVLIPEIIRFSLFRPQPYNS